MNVNEMKNIFRKKYLSKRKQIEPSLKKNLDDLIFELFITLPEYANSNTILAFSSTEFEICTKNIITHALVSGKTVALPKCIDTDGHMKFYIVSSLNDLKVGHFSIAEPKSYCDELINAEKSLCIVPGLLFDKFGYRLGFGKGYYDRFLAEYTGVSIGLCYDDFVVDSVPVNEYDVSVNILLTERGIINN